MSSGDQIFPIIVWSFKSDDRLIVSLVVRVFRRVNPNNVISSKNDTTIAVLKLEQKRIISAYDCEITNPRIGLRSISWPHHIGNVASQVVVIGGNLTELMLDLFGVHEFSLASACFTFDTGFMIFGLPCGLRENP